MVLHERSQKLPSRGTDLRVIEAEARKSAGGAAAADTAVGDASITCDIAGMRILPERPLARGPNQLRN